MSLTGHNEPIPPRLTDAILEMLEGTTVERAEPTPVSVIESFTLQGCTYGGGGHICTNGVGHKCDSPQFVWQVTMEVKTVRATPAIDWRALKAMLITVVWGRVPQVVNEGPVHVV